MTKITKRKSHRLFKLISVNLSIFWQVNHAISVQKTKYIIIQNQNGDLATNSNYNAHDDYNKDYTDYRGKMVNY